MASHQELAAMSRALDLAVSADAALGPNPRVGAVLLDPDGQIVGEGYHRGAGTPHAEVVALQAAGDRARRATVVVTLEPCSHTGRTGPCTAALVAAGVVRVVYAQADSSPIAAGGANQLRAAGLDVEGGVLEDEAAAMNAAFTGAMANGRPFVTYKFAATLDGLIAAADGSSQWITGERARDDVQRLRSEVDAIMVGTGTVLADNPRLTVRAPRPDGVPPLRVAVGLRELPTSMHIFNDAAPTLLVQTHDPADVLATLRGRGVTHVLLEGGPTLAAAFFRAGLVDRVVAYLAPALLGSGRSAVSDFGIESLDDALRLTPADVTTIGDDIRVTADVVTRKQLLTEGT